MADTVEAAGLVKHYGDLVAVNGIDLSIRSGECFGLLGPNGAGKTTTVKMIHCVSEPTSGELRIFGLDARTKFREIKRRIGVCQQEDNLDPDFSVFENLVTFSRYFSIPRKEAERRTEALLGFWGLSEKWDANIRDLSGGLKRRLMIARALINEPEFLILDEPTTGLDPQSRHQVWDRVRQLRKLGKTILLTTHYMDEAQVLCDRLIIVDHGKILVEGAPIDLIHNGVGKEVVEIWGASPELKQFSQRQSWKSEQISDRFLIYSDHGEMVFSAIAGKFPYERCTVRPASLEDLFLKLTGRELRE